MHRRFASLTLATLLASFVPAPAIAQTAVPYERDFVITAYYSPLPNQCCYVMGTLEADKVLNGNGTHGADGTPVYPGMLAAPKSYAFGTVIDLPGIGTFKVNDRGGAIIDGKTSDRLDVWAGSGEEGLARALAFGVRRVKGKVYPKGSNQPQVRVALESLPSPHASLAPYMTSGLSLMSVAPVYGEKSLSVKLLQEKLATAGYFHRSASGYFGDETRASLMAFMTAFALEEPSDKLTERTAAFLETAAKRAAAKQPVVTFVDKSSSPQDIIKAKRTLRFLGFYRGRTNGTYDDTLFKAILAFQQSSKLVGDATSPGAGRIGPLTKVQLLSRWERGIVALQAEKLLIIRKVDTVLAEKNLHIAHYLGEGDKNDQVKLLQKLLADSGFFPAGRISGLFGPVTVEAVKAYQIARGIIKDDTDRGAGYVGPSTLMQLRREQRIKTYNLVRAEGWEKVL